MGKRDLKNYLNTLDRDQMQAQILDLYDRFKEVKEFYNYALDPDDAARIQDFKTRVHKEFFPKPGRKAKARPSVAQKLIRRYILLEMDAHQVLEAMLFSIEMALAFSEQRTVNRMSFFNSWYQSFEKCGDYALANHLEDFAVARMRKIAEGVSRNQWPNAHRFADTLNRIADAK